MEGIMQEGNFRWEVVETGYYFVSGKTRGGIPMQYITAGIPLIAQGKDGPPHPVFTPIREPLSQKQKETLKIQETLETIQKEAFKSVKFYEPLKRPAIYREFANCDNEEDAIAFSNKYGLLAETVFPPAHSVTAKAKGITYYLEATDFSQWREVFHMKAAVKLWDALTKNGGRDLGNFIKWFDSGEPIYKPFKGTGWPSDYRGLVEKLPSELKLSTRDGKSAARAFLLRWVNKQFNTGMKVSVWWDRDNGFYYEFVPKDLLTAMWWQFSKDVMEIEKIVQCANCKKEIPIYNKLGAFRKTRADKRYCDKSACRKAGGRKKGSDKSKRV
jgi:hypothetical protein